jgi:hypothetical protein
MVRGAFGATPGSRALDLRGKRRRMLQRTCLSAGLLPTCTVCHVDYLNALKPLAPQYAFAAAPKLPWPESAAHLFALVTWDLSKTFLKLPSATFVLTTY